MAAGRYGAGGTDGGSTVFGGARRCSGVFEAVTRQHVGVYCYCYSYCYWRPDHHHGQIRLLLGDPGDVARVDLLTDHVDKLTAEEREVIIIIIMSITMMVVIITMMVMMLVIEIWRTGLRSWGCEGGAGLENWNLDPGATFQVQTFLLQPFQKIVS